MAPPSSRHFTQLFMSRIRSLSLWMIGTVGAGMVIGLLTRPGEWYQQLAKPGFTPPGWVFGPVWTALYIVIAVVGWRVWEGSRDRGLKLFWVLQMGLNFLWSPLFFGMQSIGGALVVIFALLGAIIAFVAHGWREDRTSAIMFLPYLAWVAFATLLNFSIWRLNI